MMTPRPTPESDTPDGDAPERALVRFATTGIFRGVYHAEDRGDHRKLLALADATEPEVVAKTAVYARAFGHSRDVAPLLVAWLAKHDVVLMERVFPRVVEDARSLRSFVAFVRSGITGRTSFGSAPKRAVRQWFASRSPESVFRQSIGHSPSMSDVIKMVRPPPRNDEGEADAVREALYGYLLGKSVDRRRLPVVAQAFEAWSTRTTAPLPDVPFEMLTTLPLRAEHWTELAHKMTFHHLTQHLETLARYGVLADAELVASVAARLDDRDAVRRSRVMPYQLLQALKGTSSAIPGSILAAFVSAIEHAVDNVPPISGSVVLCPDVSGSMQAVTNGRPAPTALRCIDVAGLLISVMLRRSQGADVVPFADDVVPMRPALSANDSILATIEALASLPSTGTNCAAPLRALNARAAVPDLVVVISDRQAWSDFHAPAPSLRTGAPTMAEEWARLRKRRPSAKLALIDLCPGSIEPSASHEILHVGGFSDAVFRTLAAFTRSKPDDVFDEVERVIF